jgi:serine/threonine-protein kinase
MSRLERPSVSSASLAQALRVNAECERFEADWRAGGARRIEDYLEHQPEPDRPALFGELLALELELRRDRGEHPGLDEYRARFPDHAADVVRIFCESNLPERPLSAPTSSPSALETVLLTESNSPSSDGTTPRELRRLGDYELLGEIARGGMGVVYRARHTRLNRIVALKMILSGRFASDAEVQRFHREAELAANLDHPNIVPIYEVGRAQGHAFFSMRLVEGASLSTSVPRLLADPRAAAKLMVQVARAVHFAHQRGFVHRDLKPGNILLDSADQPHVTDFGLAKRVQAEKDLTQSGALIGTPSYMAPEQAAGNATEATAAADVYSLGAIIYELLTGRPPFRAPTIMETVVLVLEREPEPPSHVRPGTPRDLELICLRCLEKSPEARYASAAALADDLERYLRREGVEAGRGGFRDRLRRWARRQPELAARLVGLTAIAAFSQFNWLTRPNRGLRMHVAITSVELLWLLSAVLFQPLCRRKQGVDRIHAAWMASDLAFVTLLLKMLNAGASSLVLAYPLFIAAAGLWHRVWLVWMTTALAVAGYLALCWDHYSDPTHHPNIVIAAILITGYVVAQQVKRIWALSTYYEQRPRL